MSFLSFPGEETHKCQLYRCFATLNKCQASLTLFHDKKCVKQLPNFKNAYVVKKEEKICNLTLRICLCMFLGFFLNNRDFRLEDFLSNGRTNTFQLNGVK